MKYAEKGEAVIMAGSRRFYLDVLMFLFFGTFFNRHVLSMSYHVWGGLVFFGFTVWHVWLNRKWLTGFAKRQKTWRDWATAALIIIWLAMAVTGVLAAKEFGIELNAMRPWHKFFGAISLLLVAVHIGFHWVYLRENIRRSFTFVQKVPRALSTVLLAMTLCFGAYSYVDSSFGKWISAPFISAQHKDPPRDGHGRKHRRPFNGADLAKLIAEISAMLYLGAYVVKGKCEKH